MSKPEHEQLPEDAVEQAPEDAATDEDTATAEVSGATAADPLERQLAEQRDKYLRLAAEFDNYRKRSNRERLEAVPRAQADLVKHLLEPLDDLMRFADLDPAQVDAKTVVDGANMVEKKLLKVFASHGVSVVDPAGEPFDPAHHEAVMTEPAGSAEEDNVVARVFQVGYLANGQLLRPARVVVKQWNG
jgi:molecular chaperone GrpE